MLPRLFEFSTLRLSQWYDLAKFPTQIKINKGSSCHSMCPIISLKDFIKRPRAAIIRSEVESGRNLNPYYGIFVTTKNKDLIKNDTYQGPP